MKYKHSKKEVVEKVAALCKNASTCTECEFYNGVASYSLCYFINYDISTPEYLKLYATIYPEEDISKLFNENLLSQTFLNLS